MPQLPGDVIRTRAAALRATGAAAAVRHLDAQVGRTVTVLTEGPRTARTAQFAEVQFRTDQPEGTLLTVTPTGHDGTRLIA